MSAWKHFMTITHHRWIVRGLCFKAGLYWQGLTHDLSKYSPAEFRIGARYCTGKRSPNAVEREKFGYSEAWMHHKGRNKHHYEYWSDLSLSTHQYEPVAMPARYIAEMVMDRVAACKVYQGEDYTDRAALDYLNRAHETMLMHPDTQYKLRYILELLAEEGEPAMMALIREYLLKNKPFPEK